MELRIKPFPKNSFPKKGLLIRGSSPLTWLYEMEILAIDLNEVQSFPIPSNEPNVLYGCFLIFKHIAPSEIGKNAYFQSVEDKLFIPENTIFYPKINPEDWHNINADFIVMHPDFGLVKLTEEIDWISMIQNPKQSIDKVRKPSNGVKIPQNIESFTVEISEEKILESLQKPETEEEWIKNLPFDLKKVMAGNKKEFEKYLKYIEKYPERALQLGVPLDIMGTSRGDGFGKFQFGSNWWAQIFGGAGNNSSDGNGSSGSRNYRWVFWVFMILIAVARIGFHFTKDEPVYSEGSSGKISNDKTELSKTLSFESGITEIDLKIDSIYRKERKKVSDEYIKAVIPFSSKNSLEYKDYLEKGGKPLPEIAEEIDSLKNNIATSKDSLKRVYNKKIVKVISENSENLRQEISDSIKRKGNGIPAEKGVVETVLNRKQILMADSLGKAYGTIEPPAELQKNQEVMINKDDHKKDEVQNISFSEIFWLVVLIIGAVGLFSFLFQKKKMNIGGENLPVGIKIFLMVILCVMMGYLFYPLIEMFGYNWFVWILIICVILLLYRLFREDKTILKSDDNE